MGAVEVDGDGMVKVAKVCAECNCRITHPKILCKRHRAENAYMNQVWDNLTRSPNWQRHPEHESSIMGTAAALCDEAGLEPRYAMDF